MAKHDLLAEAIADAKKVKSAALANAKIALEETFQPTLQRMISKGIMEDDEFEDEEDSDIDIDVNIPSEEEFAPEGEGDEGGDTGFGSFEDEEAPVEEPEGEEDLELEALIRELDGEDEMMDENEGWDEEEMTEGEEDEFMSTNPSAEEDQFNEMHGDGDYEDELSEALNALLREEHLGSGEGLGDMLDMGPEKEDGDSFTDHSLPHNPAILERRKLRNENKTLKKNLNEAYRVVTTLKKTLNEVNLLNAKLMYTTKTLRAFPLNESQQQRILDAFDRATTVREVKLIYTTIHEAQNKKPLKKKMTEGFASKPTKSIKPNGTEGRANIIEGQIVRWDPRRLQQLANIRKLED